MKKTFTLAVVKIIEMLKKLLGGRKRALIVAGFLLIAGLIVWRTLGKEKEEPQFQTTPVEQGTIVASVSASGQVLSSHITNVTSKASGTVAEVYVSDGDWVETGQKILKITLDEEGRQNQAQAYSSYLAAKNTLESAKATAYSLQATMFDKWDTFKELAESDQYSEENIANRNLPEYHISEKEWLAAEAKYKNQQAVITQAGANLSSAWLSYRDTLSEVTAPISGTITSLSFVGGMNIGPQSTTTGTRTSQKVAVIKSEGTPMASFNLSEIDVSQVMPGQKATITLDSFPEKTYTGKVVTVDKIGSVTSGVTQYPAIIQFDTTASEILVNMAAAANIIIDRKENVLLVPSGAIQTQNGQSFVRVLRNGETQMVPVETGLVSDTQTEIVSGVNEGDLVVVTTVSSQGLQGRETSPFGTSGMGGMMRMAR